MFLYIKNFKCILKELEKLKKIEVIQCALSKSNFGVTWTYILFSSLSSNEVLLWEKEKQILKWSQSTQTLQTSMLGFKMLACCIHSDFSYFVAPGHISSTQPPHGTLYFIMFHTLKLQTRTFPTSQTFLLGNIVLHTGHG